MLYVFVIIPISSFRLQRYVNLRTFSNSRATILNDVPSTSSAIADECTFIVGVRTSIVDVRPFIGDGGTFPREPVENVAFGNHKRYLENQKISPNFVGNRGKDYAYRQRTTRDTRAVAPRGGARHWVYGTHGRGPVRGSCNGTVGPVPAAHPPLAECQHTEERHGSGHTGHGRHDRTADSRGLGGRGRKVMPGPGGAARLHGRPLGSRQTIH